MLSFWYRRWRVSQLDRHKFKWKAVAKLRTKITKENLSLSSELSIPSQFIAILGHNYAVGTRNTFAVCCLWRWKCSNGYRWLRASPVRCVLAVAAAGCELVSLHSSPIEGQLTWQSLQQAHFSGQEIASFSCRELVMICSQFIAQNWKQEGISSSTLIKLAIFTSHQPPSPPQPPQIDRK